MKMNLNIGLMALMVLVCFSSCKKNIEPEEVNQIESDKWQFIPEHFWGKGDFFEDNSGNIAYRNNENLYLFDEKGNLKNEMDVPIAQSLLNESKYFMNDGSFYIIQTPANTFGTNYVFYYKRMSPFVYSDPIMLDIRKLDTLSNYKGGYSIMDIVPDFTAKGSSSSCWVYAYRYDDVRKIGNTSHGIQPVLININGTFVGEDNLLPLNALYGKLSTSKNSFVIFSSQNSQSQTYDVNYNYKGYQSKHQMLQNIHVLKDFVVITNDGYYLSNDLINLGPRINGLSLESTILHSKDSLLFVSTPSELKTVNAITGAGVAIFNSKDKRMPLSLDTVHVRDYYRSKAGISYVCTSRGMVIAN